MVHGFGLLRRGAMLSALALLLVSTAVAAGSGTQTTPTLKISGVPASVKEGSSFSVTASGYSGQFSELVVFPLVTGACKSTWGGESAQQHGLYSEPTNHNYKTTAHIYLYRYRLGRTPGTYHFCVYLAKSPTGTQLHRSVTYQVTS
jgi:hypothetical protein